MTDLHAHHVDGHPHGGHGTHVHPDTTAVHGMLLFGDDVRYLSHLPMFMHPHNFQVLLEVSFDEAAERALETDRASGHTGFHTFEPERFPITDLDPTGPASRTELHGTVFRDHFERGGERIATKAVATIRRVVVFSELDVEAVPATDEPLRYLAFEADGQLHLVHRIGARPSFDHVLTARSDPGSTFPAAGVQVIRFDAPDLSEDRLVPGQDVHGLLDGDPSSTLRFEVQREIYLEIGELA